MMSVNVRQVRVRVILVADVHGRMLPAPAGLSKKAEDQVAYQGEEAA